MPERLKMMNAGGRRVTAPFIYRNINRGPGVNRRMFDWPEWWDRMAIAAPENALIVETGTYQGQSLIYLLETLAFHQRKDVRVHSYDLFNEQGAVKPAPNLATIGANLRQFAMSYGVSTDNVRVVQWDALEACKLYEDNSVYCLWLDDNHSEKHVLAELENWYPKVMEGGFIAGHDFNGPVPGYPEEIKVKEAVQAFCKKNKLKYEPLPPSGFVIVK